MGFQARGVHLPYWVGYVDGKDALITDIHTDDATHMIRYTFSIGRLYPEKPSTNETRKIVADNWHDAVKQLRAQCLIMGETFSDQPF